MLVLSAMFHGLLFFCLVFSSWVWPRRPVFPVIHQVQLVSLPQERAPQPKAVSEERPKPVEQKPKVEKSVFLKTKKEAKVHKLVEKKKPVVQEKAVTEELPVSKEPVKTEPDPVKEALTAVPGLPEIMPILQKPYTEYEFYHALIGREIRKRWSPPPVSLEGQRMETVVAFSISRAGRINGEVKLEKSSGNLFYDQAALRATMGPLPPPPPGYPEELLKMRLIYVLDQSYLN
jgi:TonB family protein